MSAEKSLADVKLEEITDLKCRVKELECQFNEIKQSITILNKDLTFMSAELFKKIDDSAKINSEIKAELKNLNHYVLKSMMIEKENADIKEKLSKHENKIEKLNRFQYIITGGAILLGAVGKTIFDILKGSK